MKKIALYAAITALTAALLTSCAGVNDPSQAYKDETQQQIFARGKADLQDKSNTEAIKRFEALDVQYPYGADTQEAQFLIIYAYYMKEDYALSAAAADRFIRLYPTYPHVDYAYYMRGLADYYQNLGFFERFFAVDLATRDLTQIQKSFNDFNQLVTHFPNSKYAPAAHQYLVYLRNVLADHEMHVALYYYSRKAYVAAADRASNIPAHFEGSPWVPYALVLMAQCYQKLGMTKQLQDTMSVIKYNYPNKKVDLS